MNFDDFGIWMRETQRAIPAISAWLKTQENSGKGVWKVWRIALDGLDLKTGAIAGTSSPGRWCSCAGRRSSSRAAIGSVSVRVRESLKCW